MIKPWIDPVTVEKFQILGSDYLPKLREHIDNDFIPSEYGGGCHDFPWHWPLNNRDFLASVGYSTDNVAAAGISNLVEPDTVVGPTVPQALTLCAQAPTLSSVNLPFLYLKMHKVENMGSYHGYKMMVSYTDLHLWQVEF